MFDRELILYRYTQLYCARLTADVPDEHFAAQPAPGMNHPAWILGHLAVAADYALEMLGRPYAAPAAYHDLFAPGTTPTADRAAYPPKDELLATYAAAHAALAAAAPDAAPAAMAAPNTLGFLEELTTIGQLVSYLLATHEGIHFGQFSAWRRAAGLPAV